MVNDVRSYTNFEKEQKPIYIIALSLGAMVAIEWMKQHPEECAGTVLISTSLRGLNPFYQRLLPANYPDIVKSLLLPESTYQRESRIIDLVSNIKADDENYRDATIRHWVRIAEECPVSAVNGLRQLLAAVRFNVPGNRPDVPMLVLRSMADRMVSSECSATLARQWQLPLETHNSAGHDIPLDDATWVCEKIKKWLDTL